MHIAQEVPLFLLIFDIFNTALRIILRAIIPNADYIIPIIFKLIYNNNSKIIYMHIHIMFGDILPTTREKFFKICIFRKNASKYAKLMVESYICDNLNQSYRIFFHF